MKPKYISEVGDLIINDAHPNKLVMKRNLKRLSKSLLIGLGGVAVFSGLGLISIVNDLIKGNPIEFLAILSVGIPFLMVIWPIVIKVLKRDSFMINTITKEFSRNDKKILSLDEVDHIALLAIDEGKSDNESVIFSLALSDGKNEKLISAKLTRNEADQIAGKLAKYLDREIVEVTRKKE